MTSLSKTPPRLLTWLDVERELKADTELWCRLPNGITAVDCFASGMDVYYKNDASAVDEWLETLFKHNYLKESRTVRLLISDARYPVTPIADAGVTSHRPKKYPLWKDMVYLQQHADDQEDGSGRALNESEVPPYGDLVSPTEFESRPELISFHSFKGGVGRSTALMTYVAACFAAGTARQRRILIVDADLEAPGITFWLDTVHKPSVSFAKLLEAVHYPHAGLDATLEYFADELSQTSYEINGLERRLFVLPAALDLSEIEDLQVTPEHLAKNPENPWHLSDCLHALGRRLNADAIFIDLRAGLSELASPLLFDPRIDHFFVSTVARQSVTGMSEVLRRLYAFNRRIGKGLQAKTRPSIVLSLLTKLLRESASYQHALKELGEAYPSTDPLNQQLQWLEADFTDSLMSIGSIDDALQRVSEAYPLYRSALEWAETYYAESSSSALRRPEKQRQALANKLAEVCHVAAVADGSELGQLLPIEPLLNLGKHFSRKLPNALVIGAKGAGKTFTFRQLVRSHTWQRFLQKIGFSSDTVIQAEIFPVLWSKNIEDRPDGEIKQAQRIAVQGIASGESVLLFSQVSRQLSDALNTPPRHWDDFWDELICSQLGIPGGSLASMNDSLKEKNRRIVLVFDGIEDSFPDATDPPARQALDSLFQLPNRISELQDPHLGLLVFARIDYIQNVTQQNVAQLLNRFEPFRLHWNAESFLRLAYMLSRDAGLYEQHRTPESMGAEELKLELEKLWGKKLGLESSKEAHSARWVYTALCDLKGNVQARDLVRFLHFAAKTEAERRGETWADRLLSPESMRNAITPSSTEKLKEAQAEISALRTWIQKMNERRIRRVKVPFSAEQAGLDPKTQKALEDIGVIYEDRDSKYGDECLFVPEIYRRGLGFETSVAGRPRTQALLKKNIGTIPL